MAMIITGSAPEHGEGYHWASVPGTNMTFLVKIDELGKIVQLIPDSRV